MIFPKKHYGVATVIGTAIALSTATSLYTSPALSFSLVFNPAGAVSGINNLAIRGQLYNVSFRPGASFIDLFGTPLSLTKTPAFWLSAAGAAQAAQAIINALGTSYYTDVVSNPTTNNPFYVDSFLVPYRFDLSPFSSKDFLISSYTDQGNLTTDLLGTSQGSAGVFTDVVPYALFTSVGSQSQSVPEPFMQAAIFSVGGLAMLLRRKKKPIEQED